MPFLPLRWRDSLLGSGSMHKSVSTQSPTNRYWLASFASFLIYFALSVLYFGRSLAGRFSTYHIGTGTDPSLFMCMLSWWSHAIAGHLNVFMTDAIWVPSGVNLAWTTCIPLAAWFALPLSHTFGPVVSYNLLCLLAPALASWTAFILCRYVTRTYWPSFLGGYIYSASHRTCWARCLRICTCCWCFRFRWLSIWCYFQSSGLPVPKEPSENMQFRLWRSCSLRRISRHAYGPGRWISRAFFQVGRTGIISLKARPS